MFLSENLIEVERKLLANPITRFRITTIKREFISFRRKIRINRKEVLTSLAMLAEARKHLDNCIILLKSELEPEKNRDIKDLNDKHEHYKWYLSNLGRVSKRIDLGGEKLAKFPNYSELKIGSLNSVSNYDIISFKTLLEECMNHLVVFPILNGYRKFLDFKGTNSTGQPIAKDRDLFFYFLFLECYHSSEVLGGQTRENISSNSKVALFPPGGPSTIPVNARIAPKQEETYEEEENATDISLLEDAFEMEETQ